MVLRIKKDTYNYGYRNLRPDTYFLDRWDNINTYHIKIEKIRNLKLGRKTSKKLSHWSYPEIFGALKAKAQKLGVQVEEINPRWTSQRCSCCGWVRKRNRKGEKFHCDSCGNEANADENAAINISLHLSVLPKNAVEDRMNLNGFFWPEEDELIVRLTQEPKKI